MHRTVPLQRGLVGHGACRPHAARGGRALLGDQERPADQAEPALAAARVGRVLLVVRVRRRRGVRRGAHRRDQPDEWLIHVRRSNQLLCVRGGLWPRKGQSPSMPVYRVRAGVDKGRLRRLLGHFLLAAARATLAALVGRVLLVLQQRQLRRLRRRGVQRGLDGRGSVRRRRRVLNVWRARALHRNRWHEPLPPQRDRVRLPVCC